MLAVVFALPEESRDFRRAIGAVRSNGGAWVATIAGESVLIEHCGVGPEAATRAIAALLAMHRPRMLIATGFAGALDPALGLGALVVAANFSDPEVVARLPKTGARIGRLTSVATPVESPAARRALAAGTGAIAVDMETAAIAEGCTRAGIPLLAVRAISDLAGDSLPVPFAEWFDLDRQRPRPLRLLMFLVRHPGRIAPFYRFVRGLAPARAALTAFLLESISSENQTAGA